MLDPQVLSPYVVADLYSGSDSDAVQDYIARFRGMAVPGP